jgi:hypothetical protein
MEFHSALGCCKDCVIFALTNTFARPKLIAALTHNDVSRDSGLAAKKLNAKATACRVAPVTG